MEYCSSHKLSPSPLDGITRQGVVLTDLQSLLSLSLSLTHTTTTKRSAMGAWPGWGSIPVLFPWMAGHPCLTLRARSLSLQGDPANIGKE